MDILQNIKSMSLNQFLSLQVFEGVYVLALAFLPFLLAFRVVAYIILSGIALTTIVIGYKLLTMRLVNPKGKVVLITGCDSGFGNACARRLNAAGYTVVAGCLDDMSEGAQSLKEMANGHMIVLKLDITDAESVENCATKLKAVCDGRGLWCLLNNAGVCSFGDFELSSLNMYRHVMEVNVFGTLSITKACLPLLRAGKGRVVNLTGSTGLLSPPGHSPFSMSQFCLEAFNDSLRVEMAPFNVSVIAVRPGNFFGATAMLNRAGLERLQNSFEDMKSGSQADVISDYGEDFLDKQYSQFSELSKSTAGSLAKVIDAIGDAVGNSKPSSQYLVDGGNQLIDIGNILVRCRPFLPTSLHDCLVSRLYRNKTSLNGRP
ncbi:D-beta-hydroxybutyrate dehydrogenase, mitochondrial [Elysia marginata]|uniref:D-beta-hydroxybutyrate dehydrogenase, mitochondrial n=1 Tax=Elysia marginata TaxID=1093978 RepID=A0AAV4HQB7_9GAST|nr:D-beta-hydroxybutyrate dehydrogenase, mitochondrial [Elysia marginata]